MEEHCNWKKNVVQRVEVCVRDCGIHSVVVYRDRAEVKRTVPVRLSAGENEVVVNGLADCIDKNSIRVEGSGGGVITDVVYSSEMTSEEQPTGSQKEYEHLKTEIREQERELQHLRFQREVLRREKELLTDFANHICNIHSVKGEEESIGHLVDGDTVAGMMGLLERYETKMADLDKRSLEVQRDARKLQEGIQVLHANAQKTNPETGTITRHTVRSLCVGLEASEDTDVSLVVSYVVSNASWSSAYDVRVFTKDRSMKVQYYGLIKQSTGEDWENANISLSTAQPSIGGSAPSLPTRLIRFKRPPPLPMYMRDNSGVYYRGMKSGLVPRSAINQKQLSEAGEESYEEEYYEDDDMAASYEDFEIGDAFCMAAVNGLLPGGGEDEVSRPAPPSLAVTIAKVSTGLFNTTYAIPRATTIPADSTEHKVTVALVDLEPKFQYVSVPRLSPYSFLQAKTKNTSPYTMLAGPANVFLDNNFIAKSELSDVSPNEEFTNSLGADQSIRITCRPVSSVHGSRSGVVKKSTLITYTHTFVVKNTRADSVNIQVSEQVPLSTDDRIKVHVQEPDVKKHKGPKCPLPYGHAVLNDNHNMEWHASIDPDTELELRLIYSVEYPSQDDVQGLPKC